MEKSGRHRRLVERPAIASRESDSEAEEGREIALAAEVQRVREELADERKSRIALAGEVQRVQAELAEERQRRIAAEALADEQAAALELARRAARFRRLNPSGPPPEILLGRPTLQLRGNWLQ